MKKYLSKIMMMCVAVLLIGLHTGCDKLDQPPQGEWTPDVAGGGTFQSEVFDLYAQIRGFHITSGTTPLAIRGFRSEDAEKGSTAADGAAWGAKFDEFDYSASGPGIQQYWTEHYRMIHAANRIIHGISNSANPTEGDLINRGEAHFFRAFAYFNLVRAFGEIPLIDFVVEDAADANVPKSPVSAIYALIDADLTAAAAVLPRVWESRFTGRITWGAARALHARTFMMRNDWGNMYAKAMEVINSGLYDLSTPFGQIFRESGENSRESIFEVQATATTTMPSDNAIGSQWAQVQGVRGAGQWNLGWGWHTPTQILADAFEPGDPRRGYTLLYFVRTGQDPMSIPESIFGERPIAAADVINVFYNKKAYTNPTYRARFNNYGFWMNIRMIRYADVVLMAAEAANELGRGAEARDLLEQVRHRARGGNLAVLPFRNTTDQAALRNYIRHERRIELAMEWDRFYDLVRWGIAREVLHAAGHTGFEERHALLPIPQAEIDNSNGVLVQNPNF